LADDKEKILSLAQKYILKGQPKKAIEEYLKLIKVSPKDKRLYLKLGDLYLKNGENGKAIKEYLKLAELYAEEDLNFRAISIYKKVLSIDPDLIEPFQKIAKLYLKEGLVGSAKSYYQNILEIKPNDREALKSLEEIETNQKLKDVSKAAPTSIPGISEYGPATEKRVAADRKIGGEIPPSAPPPNIPSMVTYETELPSSDKDSETHYHLGIAYKEMEIYDYAIPEFELASSNPSIKFDCYIMLGSCFMEKGDYDKSIEYYKMASEITGLSNEKLARLHFSLGLAYEAKGMVSEALNTYNHVLKLDHSFSEAQEKIKRLHAK
jgi:tetratricopeptide (TPR) repeat protein